MLTLSFLVIHPMLLCIVPLVMTNICGLVVTSAKAVQTVIRYPKLYIINHKDIQHDSSYSVVNLPSIERLYGLFKTCEL